VIRSAALSVIVKISVIIIHHYQNLSYI